MLKEMKTSKKLKEARLNQGYSQAELAELAGVSQASIAMIETGARETPHPRTLRKLAGALGIEIRELRDDPEES
jgi:transcriptional regulator with XRE-family HTH domain